MDKHERAYLNYKTIIDSYVRDNPDLDDRKIAVRLQKNEAVPYAVDYLRRCIPFARKVTPNTDINFTEEIELELPESYYEEIPDFTLPKICNNILILSDIHIPYHDITALKLAITYSKNIDTIILNGDTIDMYFLSKFEHDPNMRDIPTEFKLTRQFLENLRKFFPSQKIYFKIGNHENRYERYLMNKAPELFGIPEYKLAHLLHFHEYGVELIESQRLIKAGKLFIGHGDEFRLGGASINVSRNIFLRSFENTLVGHFHKTQNSITKTLSKNIGTWSVGCLCGLKQAYMRNNQWTHGFAIVETDNDNFTVQNKIIINGAIH